MALSGAFASPVPYIRIANISHTGSNWQIAELAARQHGVASRRQLRAFGLSESSIGRAVVAGRLHPIFRGVYAVGHTNIGHLGALQAAVLACEGSVLSHGSAAALLGLVDRTPTLIDVISPAQVGRKVDGIRINHVVFPLEDEVTELARIPCTTPARTLIDMAGKLGEASLRRLVERAAINGMLDISSLQTSMDRGRRRGTPRLRAILSEWHDIGSHRLNPEPQLRSAFEARLLALIRSHGLQEPLCNRSIEVNGKRYEADLLWAQQRLIVEADGRQFHANPVAFERDRKRDRELTLAGYCVIRLTWEQLEKEADSIVAAIRSLLG